MEEEEQQNQSMGGGSGSFSMKAIKDAHESYMTRWKSNSIQNKSTQEKWQIIEDQQSYIHEQVTLLYPSASTFVPGWFKYPINAAAAAAANNNNSTSNFDLSAKSMVIMYNPTKYDVLQLYGQPQEQVNNDWGSSWTSSSSSSSKWKNPNKQKDYFKYMKRFHCFLQGAPNIDCINMYLDDLEDQQYDKANEPLPSWHQSHNPLLPTGKYYVAFLYPFTLCYNLDQESNSLIYSLQYMLAEYLRQKALLLGCKLMVGCGQKILKPLFRNLARTPINEDTVIKAKYSKEPCTLLLKSGFKDSKTKMNLSPVRCCLFYCPHPKSFLDDPQTSNAIGVSLGKEDREKSEKMIEHERGVFQHFCIAMEKYNNPFTVYKKAEIYEEPSSDGSSIQSKIDVSKTIQYNIKQSMALQQKEKAKKQKEKEAERKKKERMQEMIKSRNKMTSVVDEQEEKGKEKKNAFQVLKEGSKALVKKVYLGRTTTTTTDSSNSTIQNKK